MTLIKIFKKRNYCIAFIGIVLAAFAVHYYLMATLPGERDFQCIMGAGLTFWNIIFSLIQSVFLAFIFIGVFLLHKKKQEVKKQKIALLSLSGIGAFLGSLTVFCTFCTFPIISFFGASFALSIFTDHQGVFKALGLLFLGGGLYFLHKNLEGNCVMGRCKK